MPHQIPYFSGSGVRAVDRCSVQAIEIAIPTTVRDTRFEGFAVSGVSLAERTTDVLLYDFFVNFLVFFLGYVYEVYRKRRREGTPPGPPFIKLDCSITMWVRKRARYVYGKPSTRRFPIPPLLVLAQQKLGCGAIELRKTF